MIHSMYNVSFFSNRDVVPFLEALQKQSDFYRNLDIDMLKDGISVPGLTLKYLFKGLPYDVYFTMFDKHNSDLYHLVKSNIVGGPSIIYHRFHEKDVTKLRELQYQEEAKTCGGITGEFQCVRGKWSVCRLVCYEWGFFFVFRL